MAITARGILASGIYDRIRPPLLRRYIAMMPYSQPHSIAGHLVELLLVQLLFLCEHLSLVSGIGNAPWRGLGSRREASGTVRGVLGLC